MKIVNSYARRIAISRAIASRKAADVIVIGGRKVAVTNDNRALVEHIRDIDAGRAYEDAAYGRLAA